MTLHKILNILILIFFILMIVSMFQYYRSKKKDGKNETRLERDRKAVQKQEKDLLGKRMLIEREGKPAVRVNFYRYEADRQVPAIFVAHGGSLLDGDADQIDTFCHRVSDLWGCNIISINYTKMDKQNPPYQQMEIADTVKYFAIHSGQYGIQSSKIAFVGFSGGALLLSGAQAYLAEIGLKIRGIVDFYPVIDESMMTLAKMHMITCPVTLVTTDDSKNNEKIMAFYDALIKSDIKVERKEYPDAHTGFIEFNNPEYEQNPKFKKMVPLFCDDEQKTLAQACEIWMRGVLAEYFMDE